MNARMISMVLALAPAAVLAQGKWMAAAEKGQDLYAKIVTNKGEIVVKLFSKDAPKTVANFVGLAMGEKADSAGVKKPYYAGTIFHRVIPDFMIQGGDPTGTGTGGPGYNFEDEFKSGRGFDKVGLLAMANRGPNTNGSQFFITTSMPRHLDGHHTIFGEVISGYDVVMAISTVPTQPPMNKPLQKVTIESVTVMDKAPAVKAAAPVPTKPGAGK